MKNIREFAFIALLGLAFGPIALALRSRCSMSFNDDDLYVIGGGA